MTLEIEDDKIIRESKPVVIFTAIEFKIYEMIKEDLRIKEIASALNLSPKTVQMYLTSVYKKLGIKNKKELKKKHIVGNA